MAKGGSNDCSPGHSWLENGPGLSRCVSFKDVDIPASYVSLPEGSQYNL